MQSAAERVEVGEIVIQAEAPAEVGPARGLSTVREDLSLLELDLNRFRAAGREREAEEVAALVA